MIANVPPLMTAAAHLSLSLLASGFALTLLRLFKGPSIADRVVAIDLITMFVMGVIIVLAYVSAKAVYLDAVFIMALVSFISTVAFARYLEKGAQDE